MDFHHLGYDVLVKVAATMLASVILAILGWMKRRYIQGFLKGIYAVVPRRKRPAPLNLTPDEWLRHHGVEPMWILRGERAEQLQNISWEDNPCLSADENFTTEEDLKSAQSLFCFGAKGTGKTFRYRFLQHYYNNYNKRGKNFFYWLLQQLWRRKEKKKGQLLYIELGQKQWHEIAEGIGRRGGSYQPDLRRCILQLAVSKILDGDQIHAGLRAWKKLSKSDRDAFQEMLCRYSSQATSSLQHRLERLFGQSLSEQHIQEAKGIPENPLHDLKRLRTYFLSAGCFVLADLGNVRRAEGLRVAAFIANDVELLRYVHFKIFAPQEWIQDDSDERASIQRRCSKGDLAHFMTLEWSEELLRYFLHRVIKEPERICESSLADDIENRLIEACEDTPSPACLLSLLRRVVNKHVGQLVDSDDIERRISVKTWEKAFQEWKQQQRTEDDDLRMFPNPIASALHRYYHQEANAQQVLDMIRTIGGFLVCRELAVQQRPRELKGADSIDLVALRELLREAFTPREFERFCREHPPFRQVVPFFPINPSMEDMIDKVEEFCRTRHLFGELLSEVQKVNPRQYRRYEPRIFSRQCNAIETSAVESYPPICSWRDVIKMAHKLPIGSPIEQMVRPLVSPPPDTKQFGKNRSRRKALESQLAAWKPYLEGTHWIKLENIWQDADGIKARVRYYQGIGEPALAIDTPLHCPSLSSNEQGRGQVFLVMENFCLSLHPLLIAAYCTECNREMLFLYHGPADDLPDNALYQDAAGHPFYTCWYREALYQVLAPWGRSVDDAS